MEKFYITTEAITDEIKLSSNLQLSFTSEIKNYNKNFYLFTNIFDEKFYKDIYSGLDVNNGVYHSLKKYLLLNKSNINQDDFFQYMINSCLVEDDIKKLEKLYESFHHLDINKRSFINFIRYIPVLLHIFNSYHYEIFESNKLLKVRLNGNKNKLILNFNEKYCIDYYSYDDDYEEGEKITYSLKGTFSSSSKIRKSYKLVRLLRILDEYTYLMPHHEDKMILIENR